ncbi:5-hydroxytryptamine receptor 3A-like [Engraulis encrasicolus]|uniref:5-hydroxytryptamine receptor 3A-like n=1 Tax=Engraulis encrasicolus TaxID=184585 RepID=UPI002FD3000D
MDVFKFPFDIQRCPLSFTSAMHSDKELLLFPLSNSSSATLNSLEVMEGEVSEWEFLNVSVQRLKYHFHEEVWDKVIFTISIRRVPLLHVLTFIMPILFLLLLDVASFFMPDTRGDKINFKVTVLLTMSVMLLILNDTLPSKPRRTPLIAVYVMVTFGFMLLSLMESILVGYLLERTDTQHSQAEGNRKSVSKGIICVPIGECQHEGRPDPFKRGEGGLSVPLEGGEDPVPLLLRLILQELQRGMQQNQHPPQIQNQNSLARYINTSFFIFYVLAISIFLPTLFFIWVY